MQTIMKKRWKQINNFLERTASPLQFLYFQKSNVFVNCGSADVADSCQLADIQPLALVGGIVAKEGCGDVLFAHLRSADLPTLGSFVSDCKNTVSVWGNWLQHDDLFVIMKL